jgi:hypothetical protein
MSKVLEQLTLLLILLELSKKKKAPYSKLQTHFNHVFLVCLIPVFIVAVLLLLEGNQDFLD